MTNTTKHASTNLNQYFHYNLSRVDYINAFSDWYNNHLRYEMSAFAITATADRGYSTKSVTRARPAYYGECYQKEVLNKINKRLSGYLYLYDYYYEHEDQTKMKGKGWAKPHHIHGFLIFPKDLLRKFWIDEHYDISKQINQALKSKPKVNGKLINPTFTDILIEPIYNFSGWLHYITKRKDFNDNVH